MSRRRMLTVGLMVGIAAVPRPVAAVVTGDQAERIALDAVERAAGLRGRITDREAGDSTWRLTVDGRWWVSVKASTGQVRLIGDRSFSESSRLRRKLDTPPTGGEIEKAGRELMAKVFPDLDMAEFTLERAEAGGWQIVWSDEPPVKPGADRLVVADGLPSARFFSGATRRSNDDVEGATR